MDGKLKYNIYMCCLIFIIWAYGSLAISPQTNQSTRTVRRDVGYVNSCYIMLDDAIMYTNKFMEWITETIGAWQ